jgi:hypothetical protein
VKPWNLDFGVYGVKVKTRGFNRERDFYKELGSAAVTYILDSGDEGSIHVEQILEYNEDPNDMAELMTYRLTLEARKGIEACGLGRRQVAKRLKTSVPQLYRLLDPANTSKSINQLVALLHVLNREVDLVVRQPRATSPPSLRN